MILSIFDWIFKIGPYNANLKMIFLWIVIFSVSFLIAKVIRKYLKRFLNNANFRIEGKKVTVLKILNQVLFVITLICAFQIFRLENDNISLARFIEYKLIEITLDNGGITVSFMSIFLILVFFLIARFSVNVIRLFISKRFKNNPDFDEGTEYVYVQLTKYILYSFAITLSLNVIGVKSGVLLGGSAALLVGLGLGLQDVFKDFFSGLILLFEGTIKIGDVVEIQDQNNHAPLIAKVIKINVRTSKIETRDGNVLIVPNSKLTQDNVENWSFGNDLSRFSIKVSVAYGSNTEMVKELLIQAGKSHPKVKKAQPVYVTLNNFGDNGLDMELFFWADQSWRIELYKSDIRFEIDRLFREYNVEIPFPQRVIHKA